MTDLKAFQNPELQYRVFPMTHHWMADYNAHMDAYREYGYGGAVTNVPFAILIVPCLLFRQHRKQRMEIAFLCEMCYLNRKRS